MDGEGNTRIKRLKHSVNPTVVDIAAKLKLAMKIAGIDTNKMKGDLAPPPKKRGESKGKRDQKNDDTIDGRSIEAWCPEKSDEEPTTIRRHGRNIIVKYFSEQYGLPFDHSCFLMPLVDFEKRMTEWQKKRDQNQLKIEQFNAQSHIIISLAANAETLPAEEMAYICGKYHTYRFSFSDDQKIVREVVSIEPIPDNRSQCRVTMYCSVVGGGSEDVEISDDAEPSEDSEYPVEIFIGNIFKFGGTYMMVITYTDNNKDKRPRVIQFPTLTTFHRLCHFGIISGYSVILDEPVAARIIARKIAVDSTLSSKDRKQVKRIDSTKDKVIKYTELLQTNPANRSERLMTVEKKKMVRF